MPAPPSADENYVVCIRIPGPFKELSVDKWRLMVKECADRLGGKVVEVKVEKKGRGDDKSAY